MLLLLYSGRENITGALSLSILMTDQNIAHRDGMFVTKARAFDQPMRWVT